MRGPVRISHVRFGSRTFAVQNGMSALPPIADIRGAKTDVRFVPIADIKDRAKRAGVRVEVRASTVGRPPILGEGY